MRVSASTLSISWIPSQSVHSLLKAGFDLKLSHFDDPPPEHVSGLPQVEELRANDAFRFCNFLSAWIEVDDGRIVDHGVDADSGLLIGATTVRLASLGATFNAITLPEIQPDPAVSATAVRFTQTVGGRTGVPLPRPVRHRPFIQWHAPVVWTTLVLTLSADGQSNVELAGASAFPRHWVYGPGGDLALKSGLTDEKTWLAHSFGDRTPWGDQDSAVVVSAAETALERQLSVEIMDADKRPEIRRLPEGTVVTRQGEAGDELFLLLDGVLSIDVDGEIVGEVGPGAILGERALIEGGKRHSTLVATTPVRLAVAGRDVIDLTRLKDVARTHGWQED
jgi:hypothetical protein